MNEEQEKIGIFRGKAISQMSGDELLDFAVWAAKRIEHLANLAEKHADLDLEMEVLQTLPLK